MYDSHSSSINKYYRDSIAAKARKQLPINKNNIEIKPIYQETEHYITTDYIVPGTEKATKYNMFSLSPERKHKLASITTKNHEQSPPHVLQPMTATLKSLKKFSASNIDKRSYKKKSNTEIANDSNALYSTENAINEKVNNQPVDNDIAKSNHRKNFTTALMEKSTIHKNEISEHSSEESEMKGLKNNSIQEKFKIPDSKGANDIRKQKLTMVIDQANMNNSMVNSKQESVALDNTKDTIIDKKTNEKSSPDLEDDSAMKNSPRNWGGNPMSPYHVLKNYSDYLCEYERSEIIRYDNIYFLSDMEHKINAPNETYYADDRGDYKVVKNDHIAYRYEILDMLGRGSFGQVLKIYDHKKKEYGALKIIRNQKKFHFQAKIEIRILHYMALHHGKDYNIVELKDCFVFRNHVVLIFELMSHNLYEFIKQNKFKGCSLGLIRRFAIQILYSLKFLHKHKIIHCDIKPENILLKQPTKSGIRLIDFGSSCFENEKLYSYIQSRFYRSPDVILGLSYTTQIDMWSFGCLLAELYTGYPLFPGENEHDQILLMMEVLGIPPQYILDKSPRKKKFFEGDDPKIVPNSKGKFRYPNTIKLSDIVNCPDPNFLDLIARCLEYDPEKRIFPEEALIHNWILEGLPPSLQMKHLKIVENDGNPSSTYQLNDKTSNTQNLDMPKSQAQNSNIQLSKEGTGTSSLYQTTANQLNNVLQEPSYPYDNNIGLLNGSKTSTAHTKKGQSHSNGGTVVISTGDKKELSKEKVDMSPQHFQGVQHYIPKEFIKNAGLDKKSKRSIYINAKSMTTSEDDSRTHTNFTINGVRNPQTNGNISLETTEDYNYTDKPRKKAYSIKNSDAIFLSNYIPATNIDARKYNSGGSNSLAKEHLPTSIDSTLVSPKTNISSLTKIISPNVNVNGVAMKPKSLERTPKEIDKMQVIQNHIKNGHAQQKSIIFPTLKHKQINIPNHIIQTIQ